MKKYEFVSVKYNSKHVVMAVVAEHRTIITEYAEKGFSYVGMIPTEVSANGCPRVMDLIFVKEQ